mmetsp:Transcript_535/g.1654  ORF Transcript_535/g.1654 Transcript_535/m.1654 type:complete len:269 (+) Transcript_535:458-1264(+)
MDEITVKVTSSCCTMSDIMDEGISLVEDIHLQRQPQPSQAAVYFITPQHTSVARLIEDFTGKEGPMYRAAHVFFSSSVGKVAMNHIRQCTPLVSRIATLKEINLEYSAGESQTFTTITPTSLEVLYGAGQIPGFEEEVGKIIARISTVFTTLGEFPSIRYRSPTAATGNATKMSGAQCRLAQRIAQGVHDRLVRVSQRNPAAMPSGETCDLLIVDRGMDTVAPVIHEWTYEAMLHDLLEVGPSGVYKYQLETNAGKRESKDVLLCALT